MFAYDAIIDILEINDHDTIFEIGYGHGLGIKKILDIKNCFISGIDFSKLMYDEASKQNSKQIQQNRVKLYFGDILNFNLGENKYDKIFCINVIYFWDNLEKPFSAIRTALKKDGSFCFYMQHFDKLYLQKYANSTVFNLYSIDHVLSTLFAIGFIKAEYHYDKGYFVTCKK